ncbi:MAG: NAD-dependent malic enzyme, partial [Gammaproteobacteria bacterium]|nr:NAD-dependent malic enzyme [Gammaproteobacteria bacterium]
LSPARKDKSAPVLPDINNAREVSLHIARAVAQQAIDDGEAQACDVELAIQQIHWQAQYYPYEKE